MRELEEALGKAPYKRLTKVDQICKLIYLSGNILNCCYMYMVVWEWRYVTCFMKCPGWQSNKLSFKIILAYLVSWLKDV